MSILKLSNIILVTNSRLTILKKKNSTNETIIHKI